jgi:hypothetical protein
MCLCNLRSSLTPRAQRKIKKTLSEKRRRLYRKRFEIIGEWWVHCFRYMKFAHSLRVAFEIPGLHSIPHKDQTYFITKEHFVAGITWAIESDYRFLPRSRFKEFLSLAWEMFDTGVEGVIDY